MGMWVSVRILSMIAIEAVIIFLDFWIAPSSWLHVIMTGVFVYIGIAFLSCISQ